MVRKKKPVDDTPICDPAYVRRIDPVWIPGRVPHRYWQYPAHWRDYLLWLAHRLGFRRMADFYRLNLSKAARRNYGRGMVVYTGGSALALVQDFFPEYDWKPWLFPLVPQGFWDLPGNRRDYMDWLGEALGFRRPEDWYRIGVEDIRRQYGQALLNRYASLYDLMREYLPQLDWDRVDVHRPIRVDDILEWADAYHSRHGTWPTDKSGKIPESGGSWVAVSTCLKLGLRGLPGGITLARFLQKHRGVSFGRQPPPLSEDQILKWADAHVAATGKWPNLKSGPIAGTRETWCGVQVALVNGHRGLRGNSSLAQLLGKGRGKRNSKRLPPLTEKAILAWADAHFATHGKWPHKDTGRIAGTQETWQIVGNALSRGRRGLRSGTSLAQLLAKRRGVRNCRRLPPLTEKQILAWADAHFAAQGKWPKDDSGPIPGTPETWCSIGKALSRGGRGLQAGSSLARFLAKRRGVRNHYDLPRLTQKQILVWAKAHFKATGRWPGQSSGPIAQSPQNTWAAVDMALQSGGRGLPGGSTLAQLLRKHGLNRRPWDRADLHQRIGVEEILAWADAHHAGHGAWPTCESGRIPETGDSWGAIDKCLRDGLRGMEGGSSLARLLEKHRGVRFGRKPRDLSEDEVLQWADAHLAIHGKWPTVKSGLIAGTQETWSALNMAIRSGVRGFRPGSSLARLLAKRRGKRNHMDLPPLSEKQILVWADAYFAAQGSWPTSLSGAIAGNQVTWKAVDSALRLGSRGLRSGSSLARLLSKRRGAPNLGDLPPLRESQILSWADKHFAAHRKWPMRGSGPIPGTGEIWGNIDHALRVGYRGLTGGSSLAQLLAKRRGARNRMRLPRMTEHQIEKWARMHRKATGRWPRPQSGLIPQSAGDTWKAVNKALARGHRGLPGGSSLAKLLRARLTGN